MTSGDPVANLLLRGEAQTLEEAEERLDFVPVPLHDRQVSLFRVDVVARDPRDESRVTDPIEVLVDTGSELTWLPAELLAAIGVTPRRKRRFHTATGAPVDREVGYAVLACDGYETIDEVVLAEKGDLSLLGVRTIEGFGVMVDNVGHRFVAVSTVAAGSQHEGASG